MFQMPNQVQDQILRIFPQVQFHHTTSGRGDKPRVRLYATVVLSQEYDQLTIQKVFSKCMSSIEVN